MCIIEIAMELLCYWHMLTKLCSLFLWIKRIIYSCICRHLRAHDDKAFKCPKCPKTFMYEQNLSIHLKIHTSGPLPFPCKECDKTFLRKQELIVHTMKHTGNDRNDYTLHIIWPKSSSHISTVCKVKILGPPWMVTI